MHVRVATCNFELNGTGDASKRHRMAQLWTELQLDLLLRQEPWDAADNGNLLAHWADDRTGLRTFLGPRSRTAVAVNPKRFTVIREWPETAPMWMLPPTALTLRLTAAGPGSVPIVGASGHLNYFSPRLRAIEAEAFTTYADRSHRTSSGTRVRLPVIAGFDTNSFAIPGTPGDPALPILEHIADQPHRAHRFIVRPDGRRVPDTQPDEILRTAGMEDVARHLGMQGRATAVARTVTACDTHGPDSRIDRIYVSRHLLDALTDVEVHEVPPELSDHHIVVATFDAEILAGLLQESSVEEALRREIATAATARAAA